MLIFDNLVVTPVTLVYGEIQNMKYMLFSTLTDVNRFPKSLLQEKRIEFIKAIRGATGQVIFYLSDILFSQRPRKDLK